MDPFAKIPHKLKRDGFGQLDRSNPALSPSDVKIDGRDTKDILQFFYQYARQINYYERDSEQRKGDWIPFFRNSIPFQYAVIASYDLTALDARFEKVEQAIRSRLTFESLHLLFDLLYDLTDQITQWLINLDVDNSGLRRGIESMIETNLKEQFLQLIRLANAAGKWGYKRVKNTQQLEYHWGIQLPELYSIDPSFLSLKGSLKQKVLTAFRVLENLYRTFWEATQNIVDIANDGEQLEKTLVNDNLQDHEPHLGLLFAFLRLFKEAQGGLNQLSEAHLDFFYEKTLQLKKQEVIPDQAHLTFELAKKVEEDILLEKGTRFKAGKDEKGQDIFFELEEEIVVTKAKVADLRTLFINRGQGEQYQQDIRKLDGIFMSPIANSADGLGESFAETSAARWPTMGAKESKFVQPGSTQAVNHPFARLGFMLASKVLFLREGKRTIQLTLSLNAPLKASMPDAEFEVLMRKILEVSLTTEQGWFSLRDHGSPIEFSARQNGTQVLFSFTLPSDFPPVISAAALLEADYGYELPMLKFELQQESGGTKAADCYADFRQKLICKIQIEVRVCDVRQLVLQNDLSLLDANKPFTPFGPSPKRNSSNFYIGSDEVFCKRWGNIEINPFWKDAPKDFNNYYQAYQIPPINNESFKATIELLDNKVWSTQKQVFLFYDQTSDLCPGTKVYWKINQNAGQAVACEDLADIQNGYQANTPCGFLRLELGDQDFLHDQYANALIQTMLNLREIPELKERIVELEDTTGSLKTQADKTHSLLHNITCDSGSLRNFTPANNNMHATQSLAQTSASRADNLLNVINRITNLEGDIPLPNTPYTPLLESISLNYSAQASTDYEDEIIFTHLHPYLGTYEELPVDPVLCQANNTEPYKTSLLPCFIEEGTLFIGLDNFQPGGNLNLLFQMEPASAEPEMDKAVVCWEYLNGNTWHPLAVDTNILSDTTQGLIQSGIIKMAIPLGLSNQGTTILSGHLHWLKASILFRTAAISETYIIQSQAAKVQFLPSENNDLSRLEEALGAMEIAKFESPVIGVKQVLQPYPGFGGRPQESAASFYQRTSEHLRHKGRAITIYDYERLILQHFKEIYKVKCISHTLGRRGEAWDIELAPGFITVVVIPDLNKVKAVDPLQPKIPAATLNAVKKILQARTSPFIRIEVLNPIFETINTRAKVKFKIGKSNTFYQERLREDVTKFLAPWAFTTTDQDISFGGKVFYSTLLKFIEDRDYVDFLVEFVMEDKSGEQAEVISASNSRVVLTSGQHTYTAIEAGAQLAISNPPTLAGIGYSEIPK